jgi:polysaccharide chain length determinant protein (PEP-CTERM system associated)
LPDQYRASVRIYADADAILGQLLRGIAVDSAPANQVELLQRTLLSRPNLERIAGRTGLDLRATSATSRDELLTELAKSVRIAAQARNLFTITYVDSDARMAHDVVQGLLTLFMEQAASNDLQQMGNARNFINQQIATYEAQLREAEQRRAEFRARYLDLLPNDAAGGTSRLEAARGRLQGLRGDLQDALIRRNVLRQQLEATPSSLSTAEMAINMGDSRLADAERQLRELRLRFTEQHPEVVAARNAVAELRASPARPDGTARRQAATSRTSTDSQRPNPIYEQLRLRLLDADGEVASLERQVREEEVQVERLESLLRTVPQVQAQFTSLDRDYTVLRRAYEELLQRRESVQIADAARTSADRVRLEVVDPPTMPTAPIGPNRLLLASIVLAGGLGSGVVIASLLARSDKSFYTIHDLRRLGLPVLGSISLNEPPKGAVASIAAFACCVALLLTAYGAVTTAGAGWIARLPALITRFVA